MIIERYEVRTTERWEYRLAEVKPIKPWSGSRVEFVPDCLVVEVVDGRVSHVEASGGRLLRDGTASDASRHSATFWEHDKADWPDWVHYLVDRSVGAAVEE